MLVLYGFFLILIGGSLITEYGSMDKYQYLFGVTSSLLPFYTFYRGFVEKKIDINRVFYWIIPFAAVAISGYYLQLSNAIQTIYETTGKDIDETVNGGAYLILGLIPFVCLSKKRFVQLLLFLLAMFLIITSYKRGPMLIFLVCMMYYFFNSKKKSGKKNGTTLLVIAAFSIGYVFIVDIFRESDVLQNRLAITLSGSSSGRDSILSMMFSAFLNSNLLQMLFGHGAYGTISLTGKLAHNDWVQILIDQGVVGVIIFGVFCWNLIRQGKIYNDNFNLKLSYGMFLIIFLMSSFFSMAFDRIPIYEMVILSAIVAHNETKTSFFQV